MGRKKKIKPKLWLREKAKPWRVLGPLTQLQVNRMLEAFDAGAHDWEVVVAGYKPKRLAPEKPKKRTRQKTDAFYTSWEWKQVRYEALKINGHRCQCCGWRPGDTEHGHLVVDHIKPRRHFPELALSLENLQVLCNDCNMGKGSTYSDDYRAFEERHRLTIQ